jgi:hypothetical protein
MTRLTTGATLQLGVSLDMGKMTAPRGRKIARSQVSGSAGGSSLGQRSIPEAILPVTFLVSSPVMSGRSIQMSNDVETFFHFNHDLFDMLLLRVLTLQRYAGSGRPTVLV